MLDTTVRDLISCLRLHRRGRHAGEHQRQSLVQNVNINNRRSHITHHSGEIPVIISCRANVNSGQLFDDRCDGRITVLSGSGADTELRARHRRRLSAVVPRPVTLQASAH